MALSRRVSSSSCTSPSRIIFPHHRASRMSERANHGCLAGAATAPSGHAAALVAGPTPSARLQKPTKTAEDEGWRVVGYLHTGVGARQRERAGWREKQSAGRDPRVLVLADDENIRIQILMNGFVEEHVQSQVPDAQSGRDRPHQ